MLTFLANARDGSSAASATCGACCCEAASTRPGETNKWAINFHHWVAPIGGRGLVGLPTIDIKNITPPTSTALINQAPTNTDYAVSTAYGTAFNGSVTLAAVDPEGQPLTFASMPLYLPKNGTLAFAADGTYTYTPVSGYSGYDEFYFTTSDMVNKPAVNKVMITVQPLAPAPALPAPRSIPALWVDPNRISVRTPVVEFPLIASPALKVGDLYRMTLIQNALDCDGTVFTNQMCFDIVIGSCG